MVVGEALIANIMGGIENTGSVRLHNHKRKLKQRFDIIKKLGQGTYGKVQLGINKETGQEVAIKTIKKSKIETEADLIRIRREIQIMSSVQHPNIIHIYEVFENREKIVIVMEYAAGGELYDFLFVRKMLAEDEARRIFRQIATACYYCHKHKICHRDLKLENILLDENGHAKIADFGLSNVFDDHRHLSTYCGSPLYASPEIVKGTPYHGPEVDCWSLGVLLYTLVYGAMPFDGSNFKRLVKSISQGEYFEPQTPSPASALIQEMLTVNPKNRASIEKICAHWWVNEGYDESCLDISEDLANQTPVRLDVLLSLNPPPAQLEADKLVVTGDAGEEAKVEPAMPTRSQSVGSLMEISSSPEHRVKEVVPPPKRKLEATPSLEQANVAQDGKRKEKIIKESTVADVTVPSAEEQSVEAFDSLSVVSLDACPSNLTLGTEVEDVKMVEPADDDLSQQGAACAEIMAEAKKNEQVKKAPATTAAKVKKTSSLSVSAKTLQEINEVPSQESLASSENKENTAVETITKHSEISATKEESKAPAPEVKKTKIVKKKVLADSNSAKSKQSEVDRKIESSPPKAENKDPEVATPPSKPPERRQSRIFEQAEKFQSMISGSSCDKAPSPEKQKPKKIVIPGVSVGGFKKEFERKASLTSTSPPKVRNNASKKLIIDDRKDSIDQDEKQDSPKVPSTPTTTSVPSTPSIQPTPSVNRVKSEVRQEVRPVTPSKTVSTQSQPTMSTSTISQTKPSEIGSRSLHTSIVKQPPPESTASSPPPLPAPEEIVEDDQLKQKRKNAASIISNALDKEGARKSKSRPCMVRKPPVPFGASGRSASGSIGLVSPLSPSIPKPFTRIAGEKTTSPINLPLSSTPELAKSPEPFLQQATTPQTSSAEITLKSATLPRRKSTKAQIQLDYPKNKPAQMEFKTEMSHPVQAPSHLVTQRSEVSFPISSPPPTTSGAGFPRSMSMDTEKRKEHIIPIAFERRAEEVVSPPTKPPVPRGFQTQRSTSTQRSNSLSRQSTLESDSETTTGEPIKKSPREYIIPIAVEGGGYVTPRAGSVEPSDTSSTMTNTSSRLGSSKFRTPLRMKSLFDRDGSEDESPFTSLYRHSSFGNKDSDNEGEPKKDAFHMHRLRSSRPRKTTVEHADSLSSGEDDDEEDAFEFLTAENLFSTLLSRVRDLTHRLNDDPSRPGFPSSRFLSHFDHGSNLFNRMEPLGSSRNSPLGRQFSRERSVNSSIPWRRSVSRDLGSDIDSVFKDSPATAAAGRPTHTATLPRGERLHQHHHHHHPHQQHTHTSPSATATATAASAAAASDETDHLNLSDLNLKKLKLTEEDALALSYLTPGLSRRIQKQLFASLPPSEAKKITRTMSMRAHGDNETTSASIQPQRHSTDRMSTSASTLPRRFGYEKRAASQQNLLLSEEVDDVVTDRSSSYDSTKSSDRPRYFRASSLREPSDFKQKFHSYSLRSPEASIAEIASLKDEDVMATPLTKYMHSKSVVDQPKAATIADRGARRISRFLRPDFFDPPKEDVVTKEKKERERETQQVLKEIRDKRIKNRLHLRKERSLSKEKETVETPEKDDNEETLIKCKDLVEALKKKVDQTDKIVSTPPAEFLEEAKKLSVEVKEDNIKETETLLKNVSDSIRNIESNVMLSRQGDTTAKKERVSKLIRPKSYPAENGVKEDSSTCSLSKEKSPESTNGNENNTKTEVKTSKLSKLKKPSVKTAKGDQTKSEKNGKIEQAPLVEKEKSVEKVMQKTTKSKFLQTIEKKFEKLRSLSVDDKSRDSKEDKKEKSEVSGGVESAIKKLREQSVPRDMNQMTESTLIKRAVSVEDCSNANKAAKSIQPSRKSVSKILNLFKKYEDKDKPKEELVKNCTDATLLSDIPETLIPSLRPRPSSANPRVMSPQRDFTSPEKVEVIERPKSLFFDKMKKYNGSRSDNALIMPSPVTNGNLSTERKSNSKLPVVNSFRKSLNLEQPSPMRNGEDMSNNNMVVNGNHGDGTHPSDRRHLKLELKNLNSPAPNAEECNNINLHRMSYATDDSSNLLSPCDETLSCDSWSVCSDYPQADLMSPLSPNGNANFSGDENESVIDRIRRKSFYTRFNEKKKPRKSLMGNYKDLDLYKEYNHRPAHKYKSSNTSPLDYSSSSSTSGSNNYRRSSGYSSSGEGDDLGINGGGSNGGRRSKLAAVGNDYVNVPNRYQTYNPRRTNIASLYSPDERSGSGYDDFASPAGSYRKFGYNHPNNTINNNNTIATQSRLSGGRSSRSPSVEPLPYYAQHPRTTRASMTPDRDDTDAAAIAPPLMMAAVVRHDSNNFTEHAV